MGFSSASNQKTPISGGVAATSAGLTGPLSAGPSIFQYIRIFNAGAGDFYISLDGGATWPFYIPAAPTGGSYETVIPIRGLVDPTQVFFQRAASASVASAYITLW